MQSNIVSSIQHLKLAQEHFDDFCREHRGSKGEILFKNYSRKIEWILKDMLAHPAFPEQVREGIRREINSDLLAIPSINEKVALLSPAQREIIEDTIDKILTNQIELIK